jgi:PAS domain S-box-containing protein
VTTKDDEDKLLRSVVLQNANSILAARQRAERRSEFYLAEGQRLAHTGSWAFNPSGFFEYWSPELFQICGLDPANGAPTLDEYLASVHPQDRKLMAGTIEQMLLERSGCDVTRRILRPDGELRHVRWVGAPVFDGGVFNGFVGTAMDVTEQEHLAQELRRREAYVAEAQRLSHIGSFGWKVSTGEILWSEETFRIFQYDRSTKPTVDLALQRFHPQDAALVAQTIERASQDGKDFDFEHRLLMPDGSVKHVHVVAHALTDESGSIEFAGAVMDVTAAKEAEERIRQNERELRTIIETIPAFVVSCLPDGSIDFVSQSWLEYTGRPREELLEWGWTHMTHPEDLDRVLNSWRAALAAGEPLEQEVRYRQANGNYRWFLSRAVPLRDELGDIVKWYATVTDIEDRKRTEMLLAGEKRLLEMIARGDSRALILDSLCRLFEEVASGSLSSILLLDPNANSLRHGAAPSLPTAYTEAIDGTVIGPSMGSCGTAAYRAEPVIVSDIATDPLWADFRDLALPHGLRACWSRPILSSEGTVLGTFATYYREPRSPTPQEHNVIEQIAHLASIAVEREQAAAEREARRAADMANQAKSEFLARMSHELRTPLTGILGYAEILRGDRTLTERQLHGVGVIQQSGQHLLTLINDILDFARIEAGKLELSVTEIPLARFLRVIADIIGVRAEQKQLAFRCDIAADLPLGVLADERRLRQVLLNLLANAVKFTDHGEVSLRVSFSPPGRLRFEVRDTGVGIGEDRREAIFQPFEQAGDMQHRFGGTGLGLAISRQLVRLMGSDIEIESRLGEGSAFWFELDLPVVQAHAATASSETVVTGYEGARRKVLVVDDVAANRLVLGDMLAPLGFEMAEAASGREGLERAQSLRPDLILMDSVMPETDGLEATRRLRQLPGLREVPIIAISANASGSNEATALAAGADAFLPKPIDLSGLLAQIGGLLKLQWTCELRESGPAARDDAPGRLVAPPAHELSVLHRLALLGNMRDIAQEAAYLSELDERYGAFADELKSLAKGYQSKAILRLVERHMDAGRAP